jgi:hypothetical protein
MLTAHRVLHNSQIYQKKAALFSQKAQKLLEELQPKSYFPFLCGFLSDPQLSF